MNTTEDFFEKLKAVSVIERDVYPHKRTELSLPEPHPVATDLPSLLKKLKASCGAGGTIDEHLHMIEVQGDHRERIASLLRELCYKVKS